MNSTELIIKNSNEIGYGEGISNEEDWGVFDEHPDF